MGRTRRALGRSMLLAASLLAALAVARFGLPRIEAWQAEREARRALGMLTRCLVGRPNPMGRADAAGTDMRGRAIAASLAPPGTSAWPSRCGGATLALELAIATTRRRGSRTCADGSCCPDDARCLRLTVAHGLCEALRGALREGRGFDRAFDALRRELDACGILAEPTDEGPLPPEPATLLARSDMVAIARGAREITTDPGGGESLLVVLHGGPGAARSCRIVLGEAPSARCSDVPIAIEAGAAPTILGRDDGEVVRMLLPVGRSTPDRSDEWVVVDADGRRVDRSIDLTPLGGHAWQDGSCAVVGREQAQGRLVLWRHARGSSVSTEPWPSHDATVLATTVAGAALVWVGAGPGGSHELWARPLPPADRPQREAVRIGEAGAVGRDVGLESCVSRGVTAVVAHGTPRGHETPVVVAFSNGAGWSSPRAATVPSATFGVACSAGAVSLGWTDTQWEAPRDGPGSSVTGRYLVGRVRCDIDGCVEQRSELLLDRFAASSRWIFADAGERAVVIWRGPLGDVRFRSAAMAVLERAADRALFDDEEHGGFDWELGAGSTLVRGDTTLVLGRTSPEHDDAAFLVAITPSGEARPVVIAEP